MAARKLQQSIFASSSPALGSDSPPRAENPLKINIPKPGSSAPPNPLPQNKQPAATDASPKANQDGDEVLSYRDRLKKKLGAKYEGVERYRLDQDEKKERHWKRWGPYLSDRQWVGFFHLTFARSCVFRLSVLSRALCGFIVFHSTLSPIVVWVRARLSFFISIPP